MLDFFKTHPILMKVINLLLKIFSSCGSMPTQLHFLFYSLGLLCLNSGKSVRSIFAHCLSLMVGFSLTSYYYAFKGSKVDIDAWTCSLIKLGLSIIPEGCTLPVLFAIDDTLVEKVGKFYEGWGKLHDHAAHNGTNYLNGHCFVCLAMLVPVLGKDGFTYIRLPVAYRMWIPESRTGKQPKTSQPKDKNAKRQFINNSTREFKTKLQIANDLLELAYQQIPEDRSLGVLGDSWYPKGEVIKFVKRHKRIACLFAVPKDTVLCDLPSESTGKRGRPRLWGKRLNLDESFEFSNIEGAKYLVATRKVLTKLFGHDTVVTAYVTKTKDGNSCRLYLCYNPEQCILPRSCFTDTSWLAIYDSAPEMRAFCLYSLRWNIETTFFEQKAHWGFGDYMLRWATAIERLVNVQAIVYSMLSILPYTDSKMKNLQELSIQERRFEVGRLIDRQRFLGSYIQKLETDENKKPLAEAFRELAREDGFSLKSAS